MTFAARGFVVACAAGLTATLAGVAVAQPATLRGRVVTDSAERPIAGVVIAIDALKIEARSDSLGNFVLPGIPPGTHFVSTRRIGYAALATRMRFDAGRTVEADLLLSPSEAQPLPGVKVETQPVPPPKLVEFEERRTAGAGGRFLTQRELERRPFSTVADALRQLPGIEFLRDRDRAYEYYAVTGRMSQPAGVMAGPGKLLPCFAAVVVDGIFVYGMGGEKEPMFNVNNIDPKTLAGVEFYAGAATIPVKYNATRTTCGLLVLWTK